MMQIVETNGPRVYAFADAIEYPDAVDEDGGRLPRLRWTDCGPRCACDRCDTADNDARRERYAGGPKVRHGRHAFRLMLIVQRVAWINVSSECIPDDDHHATSDRIATGCAVDTIT